MTPEDIDPCRANEELIGGHLRAHGYQASTQPRGLLVHNAHDEGRAYGLWLVCRPRQDDGGRIWVYDSATPLGLADQPMVVLVAVKGLLS